MSWQPIESAPKDGRYFVVLIPGPYRRAPYRPCIGQWRADLKEPRIVFDGWASGSPAATYWMPLPDPPIAPNPRTGLPG